MKVNINNYDKLKRDTLNRVEELLEEARFSHGIDIEIHLALEEVPYITHKIVEETIRESEETE
jgi:hypothetical protein